MAAKTVNVPAPSGWPSLLGKAAFVAVIGGASGYAVHAFAGRHDAPVASPLEATAPSVVATTSVVAPQPAPPVALEAVPVLQLPTAAPDLAPRLKLDPLLEEAEVLEKARALVGSNPTAALKLTDDYARDFPNGRLGAEADLIAVQSLLASGKVVGAKARARASLRREPHSQYERQLRDIVAAPQ